MSSTTGEVERDTGWPPTFEGGALLPVAFLVALALLLVGTNLAAERLPDPETALLPWLLAVVAFDLVEVGLVLLVLRREGVGLGNIGLDPELAAPAVVTLCVVVVGLNGLVLAVALLTGPAPSFGFLYDDPAALAVAKVLWFYLFAALAEELAVRAYLQNRLIALAGGRGGALPVVGGVLGASAVFSLLHVPRYVIDGIPPGQQLPMLGLLLFTGVGFGILYELTHNLYLVTLLHGLGNYWLLVVQPETWPNWPLIVGLYAVVVLAYRRWASRTPGRTVGVPE